MLVVFKFSLLSFPPASTPKEKKLVEVITRMFAATRVVVGLSGIIIWWYEAHDVVGVQRLRGSIMAIADG